MQRKFQQKLSTLSKACDVTWPEKCKQTSGDWSISSVPFVLNIYEKKSKHEIFREVVKNCEVLLYSLMKSLDAPAGNDCLYLICRYSAAPAHTDPNISKDSIHGNCLLILLDNRSNITL